jgi:type I restriction enzyme S subunit
MSSVMKRTVRIGDIARSISVRATSECSLPVYSVTKHDGMVPSSEYFNKQVYSRDIEGYKVVSRGQFAYATIHLDEGSIGVLETADECVISPMYTVFEVDESLVHAPYLLRLLKSPWALKEYTVLGNGSVHRRRSISFEALTRLQVSLPSILEQQRASTILEKADCLRRKRQEAIRLTNEFLKATFVDLFGDPVNNSQGWPTQRLDALGTLDRGVSKHRPRNDPRLLGGDYPLIQTGDVANCDGYIRAFTSTYSEMGLRQSKLWPAGTLCITIAANIAKTGILLFPACFPDSVVGFSTADRSTVEYVRFWLSFLQQTLEANAPASAQKNINLAILRELQIPVPPRDRVERFAAAVNKIEAIRTVQRQAVDEGQKLHRALEHALLNP